MKFTTTEGLIIDSENVKETYVKFGKTLSDIVEAKVKLKYESNKWHHIDNLSKNDFVNYAIQLNNDIMGEDFQISRCPELEISTF